MAAVRTDFLIIGSGIAGLRAAIALQPHGRVLVLTKSNPEAGNTGYAQGGIAAAVGPDDSPELHMRDTIAAGDGLCDAHAVEVLVSGGPEYVRELIEWGAAFDRIEAGGALDLAREGAHSVRRVLHARDATGREIARVLASRIDRRQVQVIDHATAEQVIVDDGVATGARYVDAAGALIDVRAGATLIATGGAGRLFAETTNPPVATGDGVAIAYLAGARVADMEFVQFHPTALAVAGAPRFLLSEALRGEGARLVNAAGDAFMTRYDPAGDLAPRDRVARAIVRESRATGQPVYLTLAHLAPGVVRSRFPVIASLCARVGLDIATDRLPVSPAAHYVMGGIVTDDLGQTTVPGLFAAGETACTGVHGANRLASNSLLEGLVFGARAGEQMVRYRAARGASGPSATSTGSHTVTAADRSLDGALASIDVPQLMWQHVGVFREGDGLKTAVESLDGAWQAMRARSDHGALPAETFRLFSLITVGRLIARAARRREESRGAHWRADFPARDDLHWSVRIDDGIETEQ